MSARKLDFGDFWMGSELKSYRQIALPSVVTLKSSWHLHRPRQELHYNAALPRHENYLLKNSHTALSSLTET